MRVNELVKYLSEFNSDESISMIISNPDDDSRKIYPVREVYSISKDILKGECFKSPFLAVIVGKPEKMEEFKEEKDGQLQFSHF